MEAKKLLEDLKTMGWMFLADWGNVSINGVDGLGKKELSMIELYAETYALSKGHSPFKKPDGKVETVLNMYGIYYSN